MRTIIALLCLWISGVAVPLLAGAINPDRVAILYNSAVPESKKLAEIYRAARAIPAENLVGLELPAVADMSREDYVTKLQNPLRAEFDRRSWWSRGKDQNGVTLPGSNDIRVLVLMRGVPLRITAAALPANFKGAANDPVGGRNEASVDSELSMFGVETLPFEGAMKNAYFQSEKPIADANLPFLMLTARIDGASFATCERMINDAIEAEKTGLWGRAYVDIANKFPEGDQWLSGVVTANRAAGIPTVVDRFNDTLPMNYPMTEAAEYYGWYDWNLSGPFLNPNFKFRRGAVAMHLHSFSAEQIANPAANWSAGLLEKGAAVTIGNVYEPYLGLTHHFDLIQSRLLAGFTWVEACWMAMPVTSWQGVVFGDPLYRPFMHLDGGGEMRPQDNDFRALRAAAAKWPGDPLELRRQLGAAAERLSSGTIAEAVGLELLESGKVPEAAVWFRNARGHYQTPQDELRQDFNLIAIDRAAGRKEQAVAALQAAAAEYAAIPEAAAAKGWLDILDPPPPPPAKPNP
jgi:uncharacterized protein (TIGR03790 family)